MISIAKPLLDENEKKAVLKVLSSGFIASGPITKKFEEEFAKYVGTKYAFATTSGTTALHLGLLSLEIGSKDEVIVPSFSFIASVNSILFCNATPKFCDIDAKTFTIDINKIENLITEKTKAIMPVHLYGLAANMPEIRKIADEYNLFVIGDAAQAHGASIHGKRVGCFRDMECFSFYATKNITTGEGGMITTDNDELAKKIDSIRNHGRENTKWGYEHNRIGYNYRMTDIAAAIGIEQLKKLPFFLKKRKANATFYNANLSGIGIPYVPKGWEHAYHQYTIITDNRQQIIEQLKRNDIGFGIFYPKPLHHYAHLKKFAHGDLKVSEQICEKIISLPIHPGLSEEDLYTVTKTVNCVKRL